MLSADGVGKTATIIGVAYGRKGTTLLSMVVEIETRESKRGSNLDRSSHRIGTCWEPQYECGGRGQKLVA